MPEELLLATQKASLKKICNEANILSILVPSEALKFENEEIEIMENNLYTSTINSGKQA